MWEGRSLRSALLLSPKTQLTWELPDVSDRNGPAAHGAGSEVRVGCRRQTGDQLDAAPPDLLCAGCRRRNGHPHQFAASRGMSARCYGIPLKQSSARLPDLRPGRRMSPPGIQCRIRARRFAFSREQGQKTKTGEAWVAWYYRRRAMHLMLALYSILSGNRER